MSLSETGGRNPQSTAGVAVNIGGIELFGVRVVVRAPRLAAEP